MVELARQGHITTAGFYKDNVLYCGRSLAAFRDQAVLAKAAHDGWLRERTTAAAYLEVRRVDLDHLIRAGLLKPAKYVHSGWQRRREAPAVPLFRTADLDRLLTDPSIDWPTIRATPPGTRSPLNKLPSMPGWRGAT